MHKDRTNQSKDNWETPLYFFNLLNDEFHFTLDPCASDSNHKCAKYYTLETNGLRQSWADETVFVNPPFNEKEQWIWKCYEECRIHPITIVMIIPAVTDTIAWHEYIMKYADEIRFCYGRVNFIDPTTQNRNGSTFPLAVIVFRNPRKYPTIQCSSFIHKYK